MPQGLRSSRMLLIAFVAVWTALAGQVALAAERRENAEAQQALPRASVTPSVLNLSEQEQAWLLAHPVIRVAQDPGWPPIEFVDEQGAVAGIATDYMRLLGQRLGITFVSVKSTDWSESYRQLKEWGVDMTSCLTVTEDRLSYLSFTKPYLSSPIVILTRADVSYIGDLHELSGKKVAVVEDYAASAWIARDYPGIIQVKVPSVREGVERVGNGDVFALVDNMLVLSYYLAKSNRRDLKISGTSAYIYAQSMAVRKDWSIFAGILQKALDSISEAERWAIYKKWVPARFSPAFDYQTVWKVVFLVVLILVGLLIWNQMLTSEIRKRKRVEAALSESEENYRKLFEEHAAVKMLIDPATGAIVDANQAAAAYYGWSREQLQRMNVGQINTLPPEDLDTAIKKAMTERDTHFEFLHRLADGSVRDVEVFCSRVRWKERDFLHSIIHDVTDRKRVAAELERLRAAIEQTSDGVMVTGVDGTILYVNPAFEAIVEMNRSELIGKDAAVLRTGVAEAGINAADFWEALAAGVQWKGRFVNKKKDGKACFVEATISPVRDASGKIVNYVSVERDVTEHVNLSEQLQRAQKMESVGRLAGGVAHDFNNMLQIILGHVELALDLLGRDHAAAQDLLSIQQATRGAADLTRQLLTFARKQAISPRVLNLNVVIDGMLEALRKMAGENVELVWHPKDDLWLVRMDLVQVRQLFDNLCENAREAIEKSGRITIATDTVVLDRAYCMRHAGVACGEYVRISIRDTGCGSGPDQMANLFEPFFTTKKKGKGTGLGLATVYGIVKQNNGTIEVESGLGKGTTFTIYLPRYVGEAVAMASGVGMGLPVHGNGETLLVVEDETVILSIVKRNLEKLGYRVFSAGLPKQALELAEKHTGEIQLLITDVVMPEMNGKELSQLLQARDPKMKVLFMSGYTADAMAHHGMLEEGVHFLQKPFTTVDLAKKVRQALDQQ